MLEMFKDENIFPGIPEIKIIDAGSNKDILIRILYHPISIKLCLFAV